jgi:WD40 repeat protein
MIRNVLATASADCTVRVWDMAWPKSILTLSHPEKVKEGEEGKNERDGKGGWSLKVRVATIL